MSTENQTETPETQPEVVVLDTVSESPVTEKATVRKLFGQALDKEYTIDVSYSQLAENSAIPADSQLTHEEIIGILNARRKATARAKATNELAEMLGVAKPSTSLDTPEKRIAVMVKVFRSMGNDDATSTALAKAALGLQ
jgi:hypothetical protein